MRNEGWESLLAQQIAEARGKTFEWGVHDCVLWCADWIGKVTGIDPAAEWRGTYSTEEEAQAILGSLGFASTSELASHHLEEKPVSMASRGDLMLHPSGSLGICDGAFAFFVTKEGLLRLEFTKCLRAWKV
jgi:hypothetical protein